MWFRSSLVAVALALVLSGCSNPESTAGASLLDRPFDERAVPLCASANPAGPAPVNAFMTSSDEVVELIEAAPPESMPPAGNAVPEDAELAVCIYSTAGSPIEPQADYLVLWAAPNFAGSDVVMTF